MKKICKIYDGNDNDDLQKLKKKKTLKSKDLPKPIQGNILSDYFDDIGYKLLEKINYKNLVRADFEKIYYSVIGVLTKKISLGISDKAIIKYVETLEELSDEDIQSIEQMNDNLRYILNLQSGVEHIKGSKRMLKYLLLVAGLHKDYFKDNTLDKLFLIAKLNTKLAAFNSNQSDHNKFSKYFGDEYSISKAKFIEETAVKYRKIYSISSKTASFSEVSESIDLLIECIDEQLAKEF